MRMNCRNARLARQASRSQNKPLTATSMMVSGVSLLVARCSTCVTPSTAWSAVSRRSIDPVTTSTRGPGSSARLWQSARTVKPAKRSSLDESSLPMNAWPGELLRRELAQSVRWGADVREASRAQLAGALGYYRAARDEFALWCAEDIYIEEPASLLRAYLEAGRLHGAVLLENEPVIG